MFNELNTSKYSVFLTGNFNDQTSLEARQVALDLGYEESDEYSLSFIHQPDATRLIDAVIFAPKYTSRDSAMILSVLTDKLDKTDPNQFQLGRSLILKRLNRLDEQYVKRGSEVFNKYDYYKIKNVLTDFKNFNPRPSFRERSAHLGGVLLNILDAHSRFSSKFKSD